jgi:CxxC-x17-CxxC domain-containing protein
MRDFNRSGSDRRDSGRDSRRSFGPRNDDRRGDDRPTLFPAVCAECGKNCEVPFKPSGNKEVFCKDCFDRRGGNEGRSEERNYNRKFEGNRSERSYDRNDRGDRGNRDDRRDDRKERVEFSAICDECGKACKLPFVPSTDKPVYCSECFEMRGERSGLRSVASSGDGNREIREIKDQIISLNVKLEKIMTALNIKTEKPREPKTVKVSKEEFSKAFSEEEVEGDEIVEEKLEEELQEVAAEVIEKVKKVKKAKKTKDAIEAVAE